MPQLDNFSFHLQSYFLIISFIVLYFSLKWLFLPNLIQNVLARNSLIILCIIENKIYISFLFFLYLNFKKIVNNFFSFIFYSLLNIQYKVINFFFFFIKKIELIFFFKSYVYILRKLNFLKKKIN